MFASNVGFEAGSQHSTQTDAQSVYCRLLSLRDDLMYAAVHMEVNEFKKTASEFTFKLDCHFGSEQSLKMFEV